MYIQMLFLNKYDLPHIIIYITYISYPIPNICIHVAIVHRAKLIYVILLKPWPMYAINCCPVFIHSLFIPQPTTSYIIPRFYIMSGSMHGSGIFRHPLNQHLFVETVPIDFFQHDPLSLYDPFYSFFLSFFLSA